MLTSAFLSDDILQAVASLAPLQSNFTTLTVGHKQYIRSVPKELNTDVSNFSKFSFTSFSSYIRVSTTNKAHVYAPYSFDSTRALKFQDTPTNHALLR